MLSLIKNAVVSRPMNAVAAGTTDQNPTNGIDCSDCESVTFIFLFGTITTGAVTSCKLQQSSDDGASDTYDDIAGSGVTVADDQDNKAVVIEVVRPLKRYVRPYIDRGTQNAVIDGIVAIKKGLRKLPATQDATTVVGTGNVLTSPAEGTA